MRNMLVELERVEQQRVGLVEHWGKESSDKRTPLWHWGKEMPSKKLRGKVGLLLREVVAYHSQKVVL